MAKITLGGNPVNTIGKLPEIGTKVPDFKLAKDDLTISTLSDYLGSKIVMNIFPSIDTGVCSASVRAFNKEAAGLENTKVLCISRDLPFAFGRFCAAEGIENVVMLSDFVNGDFGKNYQLIMTDGKFANLLSRVVLVLDEEGKVQYSEQVPEIGQEPNYKAAIEALK